MGGLPRQEGFLSRDELLRLAAPHFRPELLSYSIRNRPMMLVNIGKTYKPGTDAFPATSREWKIGKKWSRRDDIIVIGLAEQVAVSVYAASNWQLCAPERYEFEAGQMDDNDRASMLMTSFRNILDPVSKYWGYGGIVVFMVDENGAIGYLRGLKEKDFE